MRQTWEFSAVDSLFFRESRPMEAPGSSELGSVFPPPARTLLGAIRSHVGECQQVDWNAFRKDDNHALRKIIGYGDDFADIEMKGVWIHYKGERLYPAPANLIVERDNDNNDDREAISYISTLYIGDACECDLGKNVHLPCLPSAMQKAKPLQNHWLNAAGMQKILSGSVSRIETIGAKNGEVISKKQLLDEEPRLGIARNNRRGVVKDGMLYQTRHIRLMPEATFSIDLQGVDDALNAGVVKLGGEGRMAAIQQSNTPVSLPPPETKAVKNKQVKGIVLYLLTSMLLPKDSAFLPRFTRSDDAKRTVWQGKLEDIPLKLISSVIGKAQREGGWNVAEHQPRTVQSLVPAGSAYYCEVENGDIHAAIDALHDKQIGDDRHLGRGHIAVGLWL